MEELRGLLVKAFEEHLTASVLIVILLIIIFAFVTWHAARIYTENKNRPCNDHKNKLEGLSTLPEKINNLPCEKHHELIEAQRGKLNVIDAVNAKVDVILIAMQGNMGGANPLFQAHSPISLTEYGSSILSAIGIEKYIEKSWDAISEYIEKNSASLNPYDIQQLCFNYLIISPEQVLSPEGYDRLKTKAFQLGVPSVSLLQASAIQIRDRYFKEHNIDLDDIDKHDPEKSTPEQ